MSLVTDYWFPDGASLIGVTNVGTNGTEYIAPTAGQVATSAISDRLQLVDYEGETVCKMTCFATDPVGVLYSKRTEIAPESLANRSPISNWAGYEGSRRWYRFKFMLDPAFQFEAWTGASNRLIVWQLHDAADKSPADYITTPPLWLQIKSDGLFRFDNTYCEDAQTTGPPDPVNYTRRTLPAVRMVPGVPAEIVIYARWAWDSTGELKIWRDQRKIMEYSGPNTFNNELARGGGRQYVRFGSYCPSDALDRIVWHWGCQIGDEAHTTFNEFMEACGSTQREREGFVTRGVSL
jgi:hypothetical protein